MASAQESREPAPLAKVALGVGPHHQGARKTGPGPRARVPKADVWEGPGDLHF